ncbi:MAG: alpha/beta hydrolase [Candidatus Hydrogenedentes bacterium]|nr:alpha/beta hydrolase [Candidatus Hydrogenedentota bacterium]
MGAQVVADVVYGHKDGLALTLDVYAPDVEANGAGVLFVVSSGWVSEWQPPEVMAAWFERLLKRGFTVFAVRHGSCPRYSVTDALADVRRAARFVRLHAGEYGVDPGRIGATSYSAGAHLSLMTALTADEGEPDAEDPVERYGNRIAAVAAFCPPVDFTGEIPEVQRNVPLGELDALALSPIYQIHAGAPPILLLVGDTDEFCPGVVRMHESLKRAGVPAELRVFEGGDHAFSNPDHKRDAEEAMAAWFERWLAVTRP